MILLYRLAVFSCVTLGWLGGAAQASSLLNDNFTYPGRPDPAHWSLQTRNADDWQAGWGPIQHKDAYAALISGNGELEDYVAGNPSAFSQDGSGLHITASRTSLRGLTAVMSTPGAAKPPYLSFPSGFMTTYKHLAVQATPGHPLVIRTQLSVNSKASGSWPAGWLLSVAGPWPPEIDMFELMPDTHPKEIHLGVISKFGNIGKWYSLPNGGSWAGGAQHKVMMVLDADAQTATYTVDDLTVAKLDVTKQTDIFQPMYLIYNVAIGGKWPCNELKIGQTDSMAPDRLAQCADVIAPSYPAQVMTLKRVSVDDSITANAW